MMMMKVTAPESSTGAEIDPDDMSAFGLIGRRRLLLVSWPSVWVSLSMTSLQRGVWCGYHCCCCNWLLVALYFSLDRYDYQHLFERARGTNV